MRPLIVIVFLIFTAAGCINHAEEQQYMRHRAEDAAVEARIDSAYPLLVAQCETLRVHRLRVMIDSVLQLPAAVVDSTEALWEQQVQADTVMPPGAGKAERIMYELRRDCYTNLLRETYRTVRGLRPKAPVPSPDPRP